MTLSTMQRPLIHFCLDVGALLTFAYVYPNNRALGTLAPHPDSLITGGDLATSALVRQWLLLSDHGFAGECGSSPGLPVPYQL